MEINTVKVYFLMLVGSVGSFITNLFGGWSAGLSTLILCMAIDFATGLAVAMFFKTSPKSKTGTLNSMSAWQGLCKKSLTLCMVLIGYRLDVTLNLDYIKNAVIIAYIAVEIISIFENAGLMGLPIPKVLVNIIDVLKQNGEGGENENK